MSEDVTQLGEVDGECLHFRICKAVHERLQQIDFMGSQVPSNHITLRPIITDRQLLEGRYLIVSPVGSETILDGTFETSEVGYPVTIFYAAPANQDLELQDGDLSWRKKVIDAFMNLGETSPALPEVPGVQGCAIEPGPIIDQQGWLNNRIIGVLTLRFDTTWSRERPDS